MRSSHNLQGIIDYQDRQIRIEHNEEQRRLKLAEREASDKKTKKEFENLKASERLLYHAIAYAIMAGGAYLVFKLIASLFGSF